MWRLKFCFCRFFESIVQVSFKTYELINYTRDNKIKCIRPWPSFGEYCKSSRYEFVELVVVFMYEIEWFKTRRILQPGALYIANLLETTGIFDGPEVTARYSATKQTPKLNRNTVRRVVKWWRNKADTFPRSRWFMTVYLLFFTWSASTAQPSLLSISRPHGRAARINTKQTRREYPENSARFSRRPAWFYHFPSYKNRPCKNAA